MTQEQKELQLQYNPFEQLPNIYRLLYSMLYDKEARYNVLTIKGSRTSGKSTFDKKISVVPMLLGQPKGNVIVLRDFITEHRGGLYDGIKEEIKTQAKYFPELNDFIFSDSNMITYRYLADGTRQEVFFYGLDKGGISKIKSREKEDGYISLIIFDEADNAATANRSLKEIQKLDGKKLEDFITILSSFNRRKGKYKDKKKYPNTKFILTFNHEKDNWMSNLYNDDEETLEEFGFDYELLPDWQGVGLIAATTNFLTLLNDKSGDWSVDENDLKMFEYWKYNAPTLYRQKALGMVVPNAHTVYANYMELFNKFGKNIIPVSFGVDYGLRDKSVLTPSFIHYGSDRDGKPIWDWSKWGPADELILDGARHNKKFTPVEKLEHTQSIAKTFIDYIVKQFLEDDNTRSLLRMFRPIRVAGGPKDDFLIAEMSKYFDITYKVKYNGLIDFISVESVAKKLTVETRHQLLKEQVIAAGKMCVEKKLTPQIYEAFKTLETDQPDAHPTLQDVLDSVFYAFFAVADDIVKVD